MIYAENVLLCIAIPLAIALMFLKGGTRRIFISLLVGMVTCLTAAYIGGFIQVASGMEMQKVSVYLSPIVEEIMKLLPVMFYLLLYEPKDREILHTAVGIGAGFATFENCCYVLSASASSLPYVLIRGFAAGVMHIISMVALAMGFQLLKRYKIFKVSGIMGATSLAMTFHALYNLLVSKPGFPSYVGYAMPLLCGLLLLSSMKHYFPELS